MRFLRQSMIGLFLASLTLGLLVVAVWNVGGALRESWAEEQRARPARERVFAVNVVTAEAQDIQPVLETFGEVKSRRLLELRAAGGGRVLELADGFEDGGRVSAGQVLVRLDPLDAQAAVDRAASDVADAQAEGRDAARGLALARDELAAAGEQAELRERALVRQRDLAGRGVGSIRCASGRLDAPPSRSAGRGAGGSGSDPVGARENRTRRGAAEVG